MAGMAGAAVRAAAIMADILVLAGPVLAVPAVVTPLAAILRAILTIIIPKHCASFDDSAGARKSAGIVLHSR